MTTILTFILVSYSWCSTPTNLSSPINLASPTTLISPTTPTEPTSLIDPPGTIRIKDHFVDRTEVLNIHWMEYLHFKARELDSAGIQKLLPDRANLWYTLPENRFKPIVSITHDQALEYCAWRSKMMTEKLGRKVTYRLPTIGEWKDIAEEIVKTDLKQIEKELAETKKRMKKNAGQYAFTATKEPKSKVYHMFDNVSEMTLEKGTAMGSNNYDLTDPKTNLTRVIQYNAPATYLGFRCVAEIQ
jgi:formylglycine-generating enzyme required for sulfatase activity